MRSTILELVDKKQVIGLRSELVRSLIIVRFLPVYHSTRIIPDGNAQTPPTRDEMSISYPLTKTGQDLRCVNMVADARRSGRSTGFRLGDETALALESCRQTNKPVRNPACWQGARPLLSWSCVMHACDEYHRRGAGIHRTRTMRFRPVPNGYADAQKFPRSGHKFLPVCCGFRCLA